MSNQVIDISLVLVFVLVWGGAICFILIRPNVKEKKKIHGSCWSWRLPTKTDKPNPFLNEDGTLKRGIAPEKITDDG